MPIPTLNDSGHLPVGIHECTLEEIRKRFGGFQESDRRPAIWRRFQEYVVEAKASGKVKELLLDGSFVTAKAEPNDIDVIVVVDREHDFGDDLHIRAYNILAENRVRRRFGFDIVVVRDGSENLDDAVDFFQQIKQVPGSKKGLLRLKL
jgi:hypothetical protein